MSPDFLVALVPFSWWVWCTLGETTATVPRVQQGVLFLHGQPVCPRGDRLPSGCTDVIFFNHVFSEIAVCMHFISCSNTLEKGCVFALTAQVLEHEAELCTLCGPLLDKEGGTNRRHLARVVSAENALLQAFGAVHQTCAAPKRVFCNSLPLWCCACEI